MNCTWYTEEDCLGSDHLPIIIELNENIKGDESEDEDKIPKFKYKHADWEAYQAFLISCLLYTSPSPRDDNRSRMPSSA